ncbi:IF4G3-like protein [Mya arenaria]|uniref:IF4G3-like protein n=1 Tax=Mya arenaria TaxID=6604 RepID=A0ABY7EW53_MYAAR|nr:IF4G3-like protein [Mya arenaria]
MSAVCQSAIKGEKGKEKLEPKDISSRNDLLQKYLDHKPVFELQALLALQVLVTKLEHPQGLLRGFFDILYDDDIITEDAFIEWEKSEDEPEGKETALKQVLEDTEGGNSNSTTTLTEIADRLHDLIVVRQEDNATRRPEALVLRKGSNIQNNIHVMLFVER